MVFLLCVFVEKCCGVAASTENFKMCWARVGHCQKRKRPPGLFCPAVTELMQPFQQKMCFFFLSLNLPIILIEKLVKNSEKARLYSKLFHSSNKKRKKRVTSIRNSGWPRRFLRIFLTRR